MSSASPPSERCVRVSRTRLSGWWFSLTRGLTGQRTGGGQVEQPTLGKDGILPAVMVPATTATPASCTFAQNRTQPHSQPAVDPRERPLVAVLEILKPATPCTVHIGKRKVECPLLCSSIPRYVPVAAQERHRISRTSPFLLRFFVRFEHFFHARDKLRVVFGWDHPILGLAVGHAVFFSVRRTVS